MVQWLVKAEKAQVNPLDRHGKTPLEVSRCARVYIFEIACMHTHMNVSYFDLHTSMHTTNTLAHYTNPQEAASHDHKEVVMLLISCGGAIWQDEKVSAS